MLKAAERVLAQEIGQAASPEEAARIVAKLHETLSQHLSPVLGDAGFHALYCRSLRLIKPRFPSLEAVVTNQQPEPLLDQLRSCLSKQQPAASEEIGVALLATFGGLLTTFIGESLAWRLLHEAWPEVVPSHPASPERK